MIAHAKDVTGSQLFFNGHPAHTGLIIIPLGVKVRHARFMCFSN